MSLELLELPEHEKLVGTKLKVDGEDCEIVRTTHYCAIIERKRDGAKYKQMWLPMAEALGIEVQRGEVETG